MAASAPEVKLQRSTPNVQRRELQRRSPRRMPIPQKTGA